jgi:hypothetical protein
LRARPALEQSCRQRRQARGAGEARGAVVEVVVLLQHSMAGVAQKAIHDGRRGFILFLAKKQRI